MSQDTLAESIKHKARRLGISLAGIADLDSIRKAPSHQEDPGSLAHFKSGVFMVMALAHPPTEPQLDWWDGNGGTPGNSAMQRIGMALENWLKERWRMDAQDLPYHVEKGGVFLKEAAAAAGLGVIGRNNLLITPGYGPNVRLRAMFLEDNTLKVDGPIRFDPCDGCPAPCQRACPQQALEGGRYSRQRCNVQMTQDEADAHGDSGAGRKPSVIRYCRACEWACPASRWTSNVGR